MEEGFTRRVFLPDIRGGDRYLRVTWHRDTSTVVLSHWADDVCVASTPVSLAEATRLIGLIVGALKEAAVRPGDGAIPKQLRRTGLLGRLREWLRPQLAQLIRLPERRERNDHRSAAGGP